MHPAFRASTESVLLFGGSSQGFYNQRIFRSVQSLRTAQYALPPRPSASATRTFMHARLRPPRSTRSAIASSWILRPFERTGLLRFSSLSSPKPPKPNPTPHLGSPEPAPSLSQRLKKLSREYGWTAVGVYLALSALDFPFCFVAVRLLGTERIGRWEHEIVGGFWTLVGAVGLDLRRQKQTVEGAVESAEVTAREGYGDHGVKEAEAANKGADASKSR